MIAIIKICIADRVPGVASHSTVRLKNHAGGEVTSRMLAGIPIRSESKLRRDRLFKPKLPACSLGAGDYVVTKVVAPESDSAFAPECLAGLRVDVVSDVVRFVA